MNPDKHYTSERGIQILISLLKKFGIKRVIASPGTTNLTFVASIQQDPFFEVYSSVDERSAAYLACGMAAETGEPVALSCTGATASRNYMPGLTEAFYRKLPILALTANAGYSKRYNLIAQQIDRSATPNDIARFSAYIPVVKDKEDERYCNLTINKALLELTRHGGGPVHLDVANTYSRDYSVETLPEERVINRFIPSDQFPAMPQGKHVAIFIGSHKTFTSKQTEAIDRFCQTHDAVVFCDHTSGYYGKYKVMGALIGPYPIDNQLRNVDILVHLGEVSGDYYTHVRGEEVWRVAEDGELRDTFGTLRYVFEMEESEFFTRYSANLHPVRSEFLELCKAADEKVRSLIPESLPFGNIWTAQHLAPRLPKNSVLHLGILNTLRSWNMFPVDSTIRVFCNVGGFGIDGCVSSLIGASIVSPDKLCFGVVGDLAFFYDLNVMGNRHVGRNVRLMLVNNARGTEFTNYEHPGAAFGEKAEDYIAAAHHYGDKSPKLVKHYAEDLGFEYMSASNKEEFMAHLDRLTTPELTDRPMLLELFTDAKDESDAIYKMHHLIEHPSVTHEPTMKEKVKGGLKNLLGDKAIRIAKIIRE